MTTRWSSDPRPSAAAYDDRWTELAATGVEVHGEAAFVLGYNPRTVLDAGCGTGRVAIELARRGVDVTGVDQDVGFIAEARRKAPNLDWHHADLATVALGRRFDLVVLAGNVMIFLAPGTETVVLANVVAHLAPGGQVVAGFQRAGFPTAGAPLSLAAFDAHAAAVGLAVSERFATWDRDPFTGGDYVVSVLEIAVGEDRVSHAG